MNDFLSEIQSDELVPFMPSSEDWSDYCDYLDSIGYDDGDDGEAFYDADEDRGFQNLDTDCPF